MIINLSTKATENLRNKDQQAARFYLIYYNESILCMFRIG